jgi:hypothetical protein
MKKLAAIAGIAALWVSVPALAKGPPTKTYPIKPCVSHKVAYIASGTLVSSTLVKNANGRYDGTLVVHVKRANHHAKATKNNDTTFTLVNARVKFGHGVTNPAPAGSRVQVIGKITQIPHGCAPGTFVPTVTVRQVVIHAAPVKHGGG